MTYKLDEVLEGDLPKGKLLFNKPAPAQDPFPENAYAAYNHAAHDLEDMLNES